MAPYINEVNALITNFKITESVEDSYFKNVGRPTSVCVQENIHEIKSEIKPETPVSVITVSRT